MEKNQEFYTFRGYALLKHEALTPSMEDYLEMICRLAGREGFTRINDLATALNVQPPSVSNMVKKLAELGMVNFAKYGVIKLKEEGFQLGKYLLWRHSCIQEFLVMLGVKEGLLEETEKIEHQVSATTLKRLIALADFFRHNPEVLDHFQRFLQEKEQS